MENMSPTDTSPEVEAEQMVYMGLREVLSTWTTVDDDLDAGPEGDVGCLPLTLGSTDLPGELEDVGEEVEGDVALLSGPVGVVGDPETTPARDGQGRVEARPHDMMSEDWPLSSSTLNLTEMPPQ
jgi:hypothetical protein